MTVPGKSVNTYVPYFPLSLLLSRHWILPSLLIVLGMAGLITLGFWQLDRLEQKRSYNAKVLSQLAAPPLDLLEMGPDWSAQLSGRRVTATGTFDYTNQVGIKNRFYRDALGINLFTPFYLSDSDLILMVDRGWIPLDTLQRDWHLFDEETGKDQIAGTLQLSGSLNLQERGGQAVEIPTDRLWHREDLDALEIALELILAPMYLELTPETEPGLEFPRRQARERELNEGNHLSYALQWYTFSLILGIGYVNLVRRRTLKHPKTVTAEDEVTFSGS